MMQQPTNNNPALESELDNLKARKLVSQIIAPNVVEHSAAWKLYEDKRVATTDDFYKVLKKKDDIAGYFAHRFPDIYEQVFLLKHAFRNHNRNDPKAEQQFSDGSELINEFIIAPFYKRFLFNRAPVIELVVNQEDELVQDPKTRVINIKPDPAENNIYISSKFLANFTPLAALFEWKQHEWEQVEGFEKVIAASLILGEGDYNKGNIGVIEVNELEGKRYIAAKIDHGNSAMNVFSCESKLRKNIISTFESLEYFTIDGYVELPFRAGKLKEAMEEMFNISENEIKNFIQNRVRLLKQAGFDFKGDTFLYFEDIHNVVSSTPTPKSVEEVEELYIGRFLKHFATMKEFSNTLEVIEKSDATDDIKNGGWLNSLSNKDPILWTIEKNYKIEGKDPVFWAIKNNRKIEGKDPALWAIDNKQKIESKDSILWVMDGHWKGKAEPFAQNKNGLFANIMLIRNNPGVSDNNTLTSNIKEWLTSKKEEIIISYQPELFDKLVQAINPTWIEMINREQSGHQQGCFY